MELAEKDGEEYQENIKKDEEEDQENIKKDEEEDQDDLKKEYIKTDNSVEVKETQESWMLCYRQHISYASIDTNNYIESWHNTLKRHFLRDKQHRRMDSVIYALAILTAPQFQQKCTRSIVNVGRMNPAQTEELKKTAIAVDHIKTRESKGYVGAYITQTSDDNLYVKSFTNPTVGYAIKIDFSKTLTGHITTCSCEYFENHRSCKHIALVQVEMPSISHFRADFWEHQANFHPGMLKPDTQDHLDYAAPEVNQISIAIQRLGILEDLWDKKEEYRQQILIQTKLQEALDLFKASFPRLPGQELNNKRPQATEIGVGNYIVFYQLKDYPSINDFTDIITDVVGDDGGYTDVASYSAQLFPQQSILDMILRANFQSTPRYSNAMPRSTTRLMVAFLFIMQRHPLTSALFGLLVWVAFLALINLIIVSVYYGYVMPKNNKGLSELDSDAFIDFYWHDYMLILVSVLLLFAYVYSIWGKSLSTVHKYIRASLLSLPALFLLSLQLRAIDPKIRHAKFIDRTTDAGFLDPFVCTGADCHIFQSYMFFPVITGFFALVEVLVTLVRGPDLSAAKEFKDIEEDAIPMTK
ncbi:hypothetical protein BKA57DRAFT_531355 [Linnemannia elongata]|nr:hypothetical protein BKA57DRAFT_531355 [Linnemannia elongata]